MSEQTLRQNRPGFDLPAHREERHELPVGSELMIAVALGAAGWWAIARLILWIAA